jgi:iron complex transport system substrate-binding protein
MGKILILAEISRRKILALIPLCAFLAFFGIGSDLSLAEQPLGEIAPGLDKTQSEPISPKDRILVKDSFGKEVCVPKEPARIVVLSAYSMEIIKVLGGMDKVVGTTDFIKTWSDLIPEAENMPGVGKSSTLNMESILRLRPELVIAWKGYPGPELEKIMTDFGVSVLRLDLSDPDRLYEEVTTIALILGEEAIAKAREYLSWYKDLEDRLKKTILSSERKKPTVLVEHFLSRNIAGKSSSAYATTILAGGDNLAKDLDPNFSQVDGEWVVKENPDFIIKLGIFFSQEERKNADKLAAALKDEVLNRSGWENVKAIREGNVFVVDEDLCGGPRGMVGAYEMAHNFHKDLIGASEAVRIKNEYYERFLKLSAPL